MINAGSFFFYGELHIIAGIRQQERLSYEEKQRYNLELSTKYLEALERYRKEKEMPL